MAMKIQESEDEMVGIEVVLCELIEEKIKEYAHLMGDKKLATLHNMIDNLDAREVDGMAIMSLASKLIDSLAAEIACIKNCVSMDVVQKDYAILEQAIQKSEQEIRKHIRIEQQMKLYTDSLEEKVEALEKRLTDEKEKVQGVTKLLTSSQNDKKELLQRIKKLEVQAIEAAETYQPRPSKKNSKVASEVSFQENSSLNNLKGSINFSFDYKKRRRPMDRVHLKTRPNSKEKDKNYLTSITEAQGMELNLTLNRQEERELIRKRSLNNRDRIISKLYPRDLYEMHKTLNCYQQQQTNTNARKKSLADKKKQLEVYATALKKGSRSNSVCR